MKNTELKNSDARKIARGTGSIKNVLLKKSLFAEYSAEEV